MTCAKTISLATRKHAWSSCWQVPTRLPLASGEWTNRQIEQGFGMQIFSRPHSRHGHDTCSVLPRHAIISSISGLLPLGTLRSLVHGRMHTCWHFTSPSRTFLGSCWPAPTVGLQQLFHPVLRGSCTFTSNGSDGLGFLGWRSVLHGRRASLTCFLVGPRGLETPAQDVV